MANLFQIPSSQNSRPSQLVVVPTSSELMGKALYTGVCLLVNICPAASSLKRAG